MHIEMFNVFSTKKMTVSISALAHQEDIRSGQI